MITRTVVLDLRHDRRSADRRAVGSLYGIAAGSRVILDVGDRHIVDYETVSHFAQYVGTLHLDIHGTNKASQAWESALRGAS